MDNVFRDSILARQNKNVLLNYWGFWFFAFIVLLTIILFGIIFGIIGMRLLLAFIFNNKK